MVFFYNNHSGSLIPKEKSKEIITTPLEVIHYIASIDDAMIFIGTKRMKTSYYYKIFRWTIEQNPGYYISRESLLLQYQNPSSQWKYYEWSKHLVGSYLSIERVKNSIGSWKGEILSYSDNGAIYKKDNEIWSVDWGEHLQ